MGFLYSFMWGQGGLLDKISHEQPIFVYIKPHTGLINIATILKKEGVLKSRWPFILSQFFYFPRKGLKAGEYLFEGVFSSLDVIKQMRSGKVYYRKITIPEGYSVYQIKQNLEQNPYLSGLISQDFQEGTLLPETYLFQRGEYRDDLLKRMKKAMDTLLLSVWAMRTADNVWLDTPEHVLILASIIEKETGVKSERRRIASVFLNRLACGMPLQSDPTVIYALGRHRQDAWNQPLTRGDLTTPSPFNTYRQKGLPPTPICCPGRASIEAVMSPDATNFLYFVADGSGGHCFSETLSEHNKNVKNWRNFQKQQRGIKHHD